MSKELEEAINKLKWYKGYSGLGNGTCIVSVNDLEIVLDYIENKQNKIKKLQMKGIRTLEQFKEECKNDSKERIIEMLYNVSLKMVEVEEKAEELLNMI